MLFGNADPRDGRSILASWCPIVVAVRVAGGTLFGRVGVRESMVLRVGYSGTDFTDNVVRQVCEERLNLAVERPAAICWIKNLPTAAPTAASRRKCRPRRAASRASAAQLVSRRRKRSPARLLPSKLAVVGTSARSQQRPGKYRAVVARSDQSRTNNPTCRRLTPVSTAPSFPGRGTPSNPSTRAKSPADQPWSTQKPRAPRSRIERTARPGCRSYASAGGMLWLKRKRLCGS